MNNRDFHRFIGVDLGGGKGRNTAVAVLEREPRGPVRVAWVGTRTPAGRPLYDHELVPLLLRQGPDTLLAVDAPLRRTVCVRCRLPRCETLERCADPVVRWFRQVGDPLVRADGPVGGKPRTTPYTQRACEVVLHRTFGIQPRETLGQGMGPLTARAHYLCRALEQHYRLHHNLIEVYPKATLTVLFGAEAARAYKRHTNTWRVRAEMLEALSDELQFSVWREGCLQNDHCFDAVICAYTGYRWAEEGWTLPEEHREIFEEDGWIWFPPPRDGQ